VAFFDAADWYWMATADTLARAYLVLHGVPRPECNVDIVDQNGWIARADMCWRVQRVIVD
jgi:hypothetical protein